LVKNGAGVATCFFPSAFDGLAESPHSVDFDFMWKTAHDHVQKLIAYEPGKPVEELAREMGLQPGDIIKLASNENPLGPSPKAIAAMREMLERAHFYPDGGGWALRGAIAGKLGLERGNVILGNGSNEIIEFIGHAFLRPGDEVVTARHAFAVYTLMAQLFGATTVEVADPGYCHDLEAMLAAVTLRTRQIFVANPNNPTGTLVSQEQIDRFMAAVPEHVLVIFDEAYYEFLDNPPDVLKYVREGRNVVVMRTFSKIQGLANLRIGYGLAPQAIAEVLQKTRQPFNANGIAQAGALAGLEDEDHMRRTRELTHEGREFFEGEFRALGLEYVPSFANFVLVRVGDGDAVFQALLRRGIIVRAMRSYKLPGWIRVSVGTMDQNRRFVAEIRDLDAAGLLARPAAA
jgi:histidinol-phosphate aminotransferase